MKRPIILWRVDGSKSSLISTIFRSHGVWLPPKTDEIMDLQLLQRNFMNGRFEKTMVVLNKAEEKVFQRASTAFIDAAVGNSATMFFKNSIDWFFPWLYCKPFNLFAWRNPGDIGSSQPHAVKWRLNMMKWMQNEYGGVWIDIDKTTSQDYSDIKSAMEYCGINYSEGRIKRALS